MWQYSPSSIKIAAKGKENLVSIACATSPMLVSRGHNLRNESVYQDRSPRWISPRRPKLVFMGQQALAPTKVWKSGRNHLKFGPCHRKLSGRRPTLWDSAA